MASDADKKVQNTFVNIALISLESVESLPDGKTSPCFFFFICPSTDPKVGSTRRWCCYSIENYRESRSNSQAAW